MPVLDIRGRTGAEAEVCMQISVTLDFQVGAVADLRFKFARFYIQKDLLRNGEKLVVCKVRGHPRLRYFPDIVDAKLNKSPSTNDRE
jgi:hypothetical protein